MNRAGVDETSIVPICRSATLPIVFTQHGCQVVNFLSGKGMMQAIVRKKWFLWCLGWSFEAVVSHW